MNFIWAIGASLAVSLISLVGIFALLLKENILHKIVMALVALSAGGLIGGAILHLLPEAIGKSDSFFVYVYLLLGFILFFVMERFLRWRHCHEKTECSIHPVSYLNLIGDGVHNFFDGLVIGASFVVDIKFGVITTVAIILHEIPQELGDFAVCVYGGMSKYRALFLNFLAALTAIAGTLLGYYFSGRVEDFLVVILPFAAGGFIYIASCDLIPEIHKQADLKRAAASMEFFILGIVLIFVFKLATHH